MMLATIQTTKDHRFEALLATKDAGIKQLQSEVVRRDARAAAFEERNRVVEGELDAQRRRINEMQNYIARLEDRLHRDGRPRF
jgi:hypothetical protein